MTASGTADETTGDSAASGNAGQTGDPDGRNSQRYVNFGGLDAAKRVCRCKSRTCGVSRRQPSTATKSASFGMAMSRVPLAVASRSDATNPINPTLTSAAIGDPDGCRRESFVRRNS